MILTELLATLDFHPAPTETHLSADGLYYLTPISMFEQPFLSLRKAEDRQGFAMFPFSKPEHVHAIVVFLRELDYAPAHRLHRFTILNALIAD